MARTGDQCCRCSARCKNNWWGCPKTCMPSRGNSTLPFWMTSAWSKPCVPSAPISLAGNGSRSVYRSARGSVYLANGRCLCVYRVAQEALRNLAKHAAVNEGWVTLIAAGSELLLRVQDKGVGFDSAAMRPGVGIGVVQHGRAGASIQAALSVTSAPGQGRRSKCEFPSRRRDPLSKPRILIADDHQILAEGLRGLLEPEFEVVGRRSRWPGPGGSGRKRTPA